jgi:hypothetical protein
MQLKASLNKTRNKDIIIQAEEELMYSLCISLLKENPPVLIPLCIMYKNKTPISGRYCVIG